MHTLVTTYLYWAVSTDVSFRERLTWSSMGKIKGRNTAASKGGQTSKVVFLKGFWLSLPPLPHNFFLFHLCP